MAESSASRTVDWNHELLDQLEFHWNHFLRPHLDGLTDEEYLWEPAPRCWTVRRQDNGRIEMDGARAMDGAPSPPPFTTIAWRMAHMGAHCLGMRAANHFGDAPWSIEEVVWPATAADGLAFVDDAYRRWTEGVRSLGNEGLAEPVGPAEGPFATSPYASLVLHINREIIHHGAEVLCLRDLYRERASAA